MRLFSFLLDNRTIKKLSFLILFGVFAHSALAQWTDVFRMTISGDELTATGSYPYARTVTKIDKSSGGSFSAKWLSGSSSYFRYFGLSEPTSSASTYSSMVVRAEYRPSYDDLTIKIGSSTVYSNFNIADNPSVKFIISSTEILSVVNGIVVDTYTDMTNIPDELVGHLYLRSSGDKVESEVVAFPPCPTADPCSCDNPSNSAENIYWMNVEQITITGNELYSTDYPYDSYAMTAFPIRTKRGGIYTIESLDADNDIWMGLTTNTSSTDSYNTMNYKFEYEANYADVIAYVGSSSVYTNNSVPSLPEFQFIIEEDRLSYVVNGIVVHTYNGTLPEELYLHILFANRYDKVAISMTENDYTIPEIWVEDGGAITYDGGTVGIGTTSPDTNFGLDVNGSIKTSNGNSDEWNEAYNERGSQIAGAGLEWSANQLNVVSNSGNWDAAYSERGSVIGGTGLSWTGNKLHFNGNLINGNGIGWASNRLYVRGNEVVGTGLEWDSSNEKFKVDGSQFEGQGLAWDGSSLYIKGDEIDGNGLKWNSSNGNMFVDGESMDGHGIDWVSNDFVVDGAALAGSGLSWDGTKFNVTTSSPWTSSAGLISYTSGKIGVGTNAVGDDYLMSIDGMVEAEEIVVQVVGVPDYVFHEGYDLKTLDEIADYIDQNSHLPEIPSATELEETGMSLGEMNLLLLKKIEELTLHLIEIKYSANAKDEKIEKLSRRLKVLEELNNN